MQGPGQSSPGLPQSNTLSEPQSDLQDDVGRHSATFVGHRDCYWKWWSMPSVPHVLQLESCLIFGKKIANSGLVHKTEAGAYSKSCKRPMQSSDDVDINGTKHVRTF